MPASILTVLLWLLAALLVVTGFVGSVLPVLPGAPLVFLGLLIAAWIDSFSRVGWLTLTVLGFLAIFAILIDFAATALGAKRVGASRLAIAGAAVGTVCGIFFGLPGIILGPFIGAVAGEYAARARLPEAAKVGFGTWIGLVLGTAVKLAVLFMMVGIFTAAYIM